MNSFTLPITANGAIVRVQVSFGAEAIARLRAEGKAIPQPIVMDALVDSGANVSCIDSSVLDPLCRAGLRHRSIILANIPALGGIGLVLEFDVGLRVLHPSGIARDDLVLGNHIIVEKNLASIGYEALIGRDILSKCILLFDGPSDRFTLAY